MLPAVGEVRLAPAGEGAPTVSELGDASSWPVLGTLSGMPIRDASPVEAMDQIIRAFDVTVDMMGSAVPPAARGELRLRETIRQRVEWRGIPAAPGTSARAPRRSNNWRKRSCRSSGTVDRSSAKSAERCSASHAPSKGSGA